MKKIIIIALILALSVGLLLAGCTPEAQEKVKNAINNATVELQTGDTYNWTPSFYKTDSEDNKTVISYSPSDITYESNNPSSVSVDSNGLITAIAPTGATLTAYYHKDQDDSAIAMIFITVYSPYETISVGGSTTWDALGAIKTYAGTESTINFETGTISCSEGAGKGSVTISETSRGVYQITGSSAGFVTVNASYSGGGSASIVIKVG